uniref:Mitochondrial ribosomal protein S18B n=1 Tax=Cyanoderma ruficeps TaxID=181631 RepID=A0A8C3XB91_9PASS
CHHSERNYDVITSPQDLPRLCSTQETPKDPPPAPSPYQDRPWEYLESEEYRAAYGDNPVWHGYHRNHKGSVPPQRTRKACLRRGKRVGNPCPICRDRNLLVDFRNVKLLDQFICPHSGVIFHPIHTGEGTPEGHLGVLGVTLGSPLVSLGSPWCPWLTPVPVSPQGSACSSTSACPRPSPRPRPTVSPPPRVFRASQPTLGCPPNPSVSPFQVSCGSTSPLCRSPRRISPTDTRPWAKPPRRLP